MGQDTRALLSASHRIRLGVHGTSVPAAPGGLRETTGAMDLEPGVPGASWFTRVTRPLSPGEVTSLPKPSVLPGPLDGSQELLVRGSRGLVGCWLLTCSFHNTAPQLGSLSQFVPASGGQVRNSRSQEGQAPPKSYRGGCFLTSSSIWFASCPCSLAYRCIAPVCLCPHRALFPECFCVPPLYKDISHSGVRA